MEAWNPYKFTNANEVVTVLILLMLLAVLAGMTLAPRQYRRRMVFLPLLLFWVFTILSATYFGRLETESGKMRLELFWTIRAAWRERNGLYWYYIIGNILLFIPLGFLLPLTDERYENWLAVTLTGAVLSLLVEGLQYVTKTGLCEVDDLFHNTLGTFTGYQMYVVICHLFGWGNGKRHDGIGSDKRLWGVSLVYLSGLCLLFVVLLYWNRPDWTGVFD